MFHYDLNRRFDTVVGATDVAVTAARDLEARGRKHGQPFLISPSGRPDVRVNAFFSSRKMLGKSPLTWRKYSYSLGLWLNFLAVLEQQWDAATEEDAQYFKEWRITEESNLNRVDSSTFRGDLVALRSFYRWAAPKFGIIDPVALIDDHDLMPSGPRQKDIKWLDPAGYRRWRDLGLRGLDVDGRPDPGFRGRNEQRDAAFAEGLYGTGLRLTEWASVLICELPEDDPGRGYATRWLANACAKGGYGHKYWMSRRTSTEVLSYVEGARARVVRRAQHAGRYERLRRVRLVLGVDGDRLVVMEPDGRQTTPAIDAIGPVMRRRLFCRTPQGLEPMAVWLNEDGLPRVPHGWEHTFGNANARIAGLGFPGLRATPHHLRHSFCLRWYSIGKLVYEAKLEHLGETERKDFREQFGDTWDLVATMVGHRNPQTTREHYLEPFRSLDVELLLRHAADANLPEFLAGFLARHPRVRTDPVGDAR
ncbi:site-specific integrase [Saccharothrix lopnurensis]|uniref:site-specific integrase n=1 Tax=Saccharothrix lopnurensis TaxID=1670621 RepID=UPI0036D40F2C